jgi:hypoxanthine phosphoribosyltransferase
MLDLRVNRPEAVAALADLELQNRTRRKARFGKAMVTPQDFDLIVNAGTFDTDQVSMLIETAVAAKQLAEAGVLAAGAEMQIQFQSRLSLARFGITPAGKATIKKKPFGHTSEELFANLLDFYRIAWEYEPRSFPLQWDKEGRVLEAFTPDFYLPEYDLYVELTTMKQSLVTKKNRKVKLLRAIYPHVNIQVFYQKDFQDLVSKYGLADRLTPA